MTCHAISRILFAVSIVLVLSVAWGFSDVVVYEPFDYPAGSLDGAGGTSEFGFSGNWIAVNAGLEGQVVSNSLAYGSLPTNGNSVISGSGARYIGGTRAVDPAALSPSGLLGAGEVVWFSVVMGLHTNALAATPKLGFCLANDSFNAGRDNYCIADDGAQLGSGLGVELQEGKARAAHYRDLSFGNYFYGPIYGASSTTQYAYAEHGLIVGKITWGVTVEDPNKITPADGEWDKIELYQPGTDLVMPASPFSTLSVVVDQSTYDTITWRRNDDEAMDEIRFGSNYNDVVGADSSSDAVSPTPATMTFFEAPVEASTTSIRMIAAVADDPSGVEYYFTCTGGIGGHDSGWQSSRIYIDTGLTEGVSYTYTVQARDCSPGGNVNTVSSGSSAVPKAVDSTAPTPTTLTWEDPPTAVSSNAIVMTATTATDASGVEYYFENLTLRTNSGWQDNPTYTNTGLSTFRSYSYRVKARDKAHLQNEGVWSEILPAVTTPAHGVAAVLTEGQHFILVSQNTAGFYDYDISVTTGAAKFSGITGADGPVYGHFGDGTVTDYCFFHESAVPDVIEAYATGSVGRISTALATVPPGGTGLTSDSGADLWTTTDPGDDFGSVPDFTSGTGLGTGGNTVSAPIDISDIHEGIVYFVYGAYRNTPSFEITMTGAGQSDVTLPGVGDNDGANNGESYVVSVGFHNNGAYDTITYTFTSSNSRFIGVVLWELPPPPSGTVLIIR